MTGLFMISGLVTLSFAIYKDDWARCDNCTVHLREHSNCKCTYNDTACKDKCIWVVPDQLRLAALMCELLSVFLLILSSVIGIVVMFLTNCCDERHSYRRSCCCLCFISGVNILSGLVCLSGCVILLEMFWEFEDFGVSLYSSLTAGGLLFCTSLLHMCCFSKITREAHHGQYEIIRGEDTDTNIGHSRHVPEHVE